jgi:adenosylcobinamide-GDP ribazoletransferase
MKVLAAFIFFTRLPFWRIKEVPAKYLNVCSILAISGWLTGGITVDTVDSSSDTSHFHRMGTCHPLPIAYHRLSARRRTGDFFDGFGGGPPKNGHLPL